MKQRKYKRIKITAISRLDNAELTVINISKEGMMLYGSCNSRKKMVDIQLKIRGKWLDLKGKIVWCLEGEAQDLKRVGICITDAPPEYNEFVDNLYLEADEKN